MTFIFGQHDDNTLDQIHDVASRAAFTALMGDGHLGYIMPIGGVAAYRNHVSVAGVGYDISCGNCAIKTNIRVDDIKDNLEELADDIAYEISFGIGRNNTSHDSPDDHPLFNDDRWYLYPGHVRESLRSNARQQLGTVGGGNHYVDVFSADDGYVWVGVHFGSRGLGHKTASGFMALSQGEKFNVKVAEAEALLSLSSNLGSDYWNLMNLCGDYAYAGREWVSRKVASMLGATQELDLVHNHHNFAWAENHFGEDLIVVRKGATPAFPGQRGFVGGSMGDVSVILRGTENADSTTLDTQQSALFSTVHGAGRVMSRRAAVGKTKGWGKNRTIVSPGAVSLDMLNEWVGKMGVVRRGGDVDEAPHVYRRLPDVLAVQGNTITVETYLKPLIVVMAGADIVDPYKD